MQTNFYFDTTTKFNNYPFTFKGYEKTFMMIKPDAFQRNLENVIETNIIESGLKISESFTGVAPKKKSRIIILPSNINLFLKNG